MYSIKFFLIISFCKQKTRSAFHFVASFAQLLYLDLHFDDDISWSYVEGTERF